MEKFPTLPVLRWASFGPELLKIIEAVINKIDREWPVKWQNVPAAAVLMESLARTTQNTYNTIKILCSDDPKWPIEREHALSAGPLSRSILDSLFTTIFVFEDVPVRSSWYFKAGWREVWEEHQRYKTTYGNDPQWQEWLTEKQRFLDSTPTQYGLTATERADPTSIRRWPIPSHMRGDKTTSPPRLKLMEFLYDWYYRHLSSESHLSLPGLIVRSMALNPGEDPEERAWQLDKQRSDNFLTATVFVASFVSEIEIECRFGLSERLKYVWTILGDYFGLAKELYDPWYSARL